MGVSGCCWLLQNVVWAFRVMMPNANERLRSWSVYRG